MFKKAFKIVATFSLLVGAYFGYVRGFAAVEGLLAREVDTEATPFPETESKSAIRAGELARETLGPKSWASLKPKIVHYDQSRGYYLYADNYKRLDDGKRVEIWPFAMVWASKDGRSRKTATSDRAIIDLSQPFGFAKVGSEPSKVVHAQLKGDVWLRDDKGTRDDETDDLRVGPLTHLEYDEATLRITTDSEVILQDRDLRLTCVGMMIQLRRKATTPGSPPATAGAGFDAETAHMYKPVHVTVKNVGSNGVLPGTARPEKGGQTPLNVWADDEMRIDLPRPHPAVLIGPPELDRPPDPTKVYFKTNVRVTRGTAELDQLNCDTLDLTFMPKPKANDPATATVAAVDGQPGAPVATPPAPSQGGPVSDLALRIAKARGHAVWIQSESQGLKARCIALDYTKASEPGVPDKTYLNGGTARKLWVEKVEYDATGPGLRLMPGLGDLGGIPATGKNLIIVAEVRQRLHFRVFDADGQRVVDAGEAQYPDQEGQVADLKVLLANSWRQPELPPAERLRAINAIASIVGPAHIKGPDPSAIKSVMTLYAMDATIFDYGPGGTSEVIARGPGRSEDRPGRNASVTHTAYWEDELKLVTWRDGQARPGAGAVASKTPPDGKATLRRLLTLTGDPKLIEHKDPTTLDAHRSIVAEFHTVPPATPEGKEETRIKWLQAFEDVHLTAPAKTLTARHQLDAKFEAAQVVLAASPSPNPNPTTPASPTAPAPPIGPATTFLAPAPKVAAAPKPDGPAPAAPPPAQAVDARADRVWATIILGSGERPNGELKDAQLRGGVMVHQEPAPGKAVGNDATGEALDLFGQGDGLMKFVVAAEPPQAANPRAKLASGASARPATTAVLARVDFEGRTIEAPLIGLDQKLDYAWAQGAGNFLQMADRGLLDDKGIAADGAKSAARPNGLLNPAKDRLVITWNEEMKFFGRAADLQGRPAAKAEFRGASREVRMPDDRRTFRRGVEARMTDAAVYCDTMDVYMDRVIALNKQTGKPKVAGEPAEPDAQIALMDCRGKDRVEDDKLKYAGVDITSQKLFPGTNILKEKQRIQSTHVTYDKRTGDFECPGPGTTYLYKRKNAPGVVQPTALPVSGPGTRGRTPTLPEVQRVPPLELTRVQYTEGMRGRFGTSKEQAESQTRHAEFVGNVQAADATVRDGFSDIDNDRPNSADYLFLSSDVLHVYSEPPKESKGTARQFLFARGNAVARTMDRIIQADRVTYDSATELTYAFGDDDKDIVMNEQKSTVQEPTTIRGKSGRYNKRTKAGEILDPQAIQMYDLKTGVRVAPFAPDTGGTPKPPPPIKPIRIPLMNTPKNSTERRGFSSGQ